MSYQLFFRIEQLNELNEKVQKALSLSQSLVQERQKVLHEMNEAIRLKEVFESKYQQREASYLDMQRRVQEHDAIVQSLKQSLEQQLAQSERAREQLSIELSVLIKVVFKKCCKIYPLLV